VRWFGDYKDVVPGRSRGFCIGLRFWYPAAKHEYRALDATVLRNREGKVVPMDARRRMAYAIWTYGRSAKQSHQAAVMLYVHALMGDGRPGELHPKAIGPDVARIYADVERNAARYHGPYRIEVKGPAKLRVGESGTATVRVLSASGTALPRVALDLVAAGARGVPKKARTNAAGIATVAFTASGAGGVRLSATAAGLAATLPSVWAPTTAAAKPNGQRLVIPTSQDVAGRGSTAVELTTIAVETTAAPAVVAVGEESRDTVTISNAAAGWAVAVRAELHGPFRTTSSIRCDRPPAWQGSFRTKGPGTYRTPPARLARPGWYVYRLVVPDDDAHAGLTTPCGDARERVKVEAQPQVTTVVSDRTATLGEPIFDRVRVTGLAGEKATVHALLYGPFAKRSAVTCTVAPVWSGSVAATGDGEYRTAPVRLSTSGWYTYVERIDAGASSARPRPHAERSPRRRSPVLTRP
jgi:hypothetical protein